MTTTIALALMLAYGVPLTRALAPRLRPLPLAGASFLIGAGAVVLHLFVLTVLHIRWSRTSLVIALVPLLALALFVARRRAGRAMAVAVRAIQPQARWMTVFDVATILIVISYAIFATWAPPFEWDFYGIWGLKGRWFHDARGIDWTFVQTNISHPDYPLLMPLLFDAVAILTGRWNDASFGWIYVALCASVVAIARGMFAEESKWAALATVAIAFPALNLWVGLAEAGVMAFGCAGLLFIRRGDDRLGAILLGLSAWSKNEGLALIGVALLALFVTTRSVRRVVALWPAVAVIAPWLIARSVLSLPTDFMQGSIVGRVLKQLGDPAAVVRAFASSPPDQPWFWLAVLLAIVALLRDAIRRELFLLLAVVLQFSLMAGQTLATMWDFASHVSLTMNRLPHQIAPVAGFLAVVLALRAMEVPAKIGDP